MSRNPDSGDKCLTEGFGRILFLNILGSLIFLGLCEILIHIRDCVEGLWTFCTSPGFTVSNCCKRNGDDDDDMILKLRARSTMDSYESIPEARGMTYRKFVF